MEHTERQRIQVNLHAYLKTIEPHPYSHGVALTRVRREIKALLEASEKQNRYDPDRIKDLAESLEVSARNFIFTNEYDSLDVTAKKHLFERAGFDLYAISQGYPAPAVFGAYYEARRDMGLEAQLVA